MTKNAARSGHKLPVALDMEEVRALLHSPNIKTPTGLRNRAILEVMYRAGLRVSEVVGLRPSDIRWESSILEIHQGKGSKDRNVPFDQETLGWLRAWDTNRHKSRRFFCTLQGNEMSSRYIQSMVKRLAHKASLQRAQKITPHVLRHTYATELLADGFTIREVQELLGHSSVATTQIYTHVRPEHLVEKIIRRNQTCEDNIEITTLAKKISKLSDEARTVLVELLQSSY